MSGLRTNGVTIGVVGPRDLVERVMLMGRGSRPVGGEWRLVGAAYREPHETVDRLAQLGDDVDACLFTGPVPYDLARESGALAVPATFVPLSGSSLYAALLRGVATGVCDPARVSVDVLSRTDVEEAYAEIGVDAGGVRLREYQPAESPAEIASFHEELCRDGAVTAALTCVPAVAELLAETSVPLLRVQPTTAAIREALRVAALIGAGSRLEEAQIAIGIVDVPTMRQAPGTGRSPYWREELRLSLHRVLLHEARRMGATVRPLDEHSYVVTATFGSVAAATDGFRVPLFVDRVRTELGIAVEVGIGLGATAHDAEANAGDALARAQASGEERGLVVGPSGQVLALSARHHASRSRRGTARTRGFEILSRLVTALGSRASGGPIVVDAETAAKVLDVTPRTARRMLRTLVDEGLAWPLPPNRAPQPGRPRQLYRLIVEKLGQSEERGPG